MSDLPADATFLLAALPPTRRQERMALAVVAALVAIVAAVFPFRAIALPFFALPLAAMQTLIAGADLIIAVLLYSQFAILGWRSLLWLAGCYVYTAIICTLHYLSYPGVLSPTGAFGPQATGWLFVAWHIALPLTSIAYVLRQGEEHKTGRAYRPTPAAIAFNASMMVALAGTSVSLAWLANNYLPPFFTDAAHMTSTGRTAMMALILLIAGAVATLSARRRSALDMWLMVVLAAWLIAIVYSVLVVGVQFSVAFYVVRAYWLITVLLVLVALLSESTMLYARLAYSIVISRGQRVAQVVAVDAMSATFAHELSQPVAALVANGEAALLWLSRTPPDLSKVKHSLEQVAADARRTSEALASVRAMFQGSAARRERLDINLLIREVLAIESQRLHERAVRVELNLAQGLTRVPADRAQLQQVLLNLVANAIDAMAPVADRARVLRVQTRTSELPRSFDRDRRYRQWLQRRGRGAHFRSVLHHEAARNRTGPLGLPKNHRAS